MYIKEKLSQTVLGWVIPSKIGQEINKVIAADIRDRMDSIKDLCRASFTCNVTNTGLLLRRYPDIPKDMVPKKSILLFVMCLKQTLHPHRFIDYINTNCAGALPFKLNDDNVIYLGSHTIDSSDRKFDLFVTKIKDDEPTKKELSDAKTKILQTQQEVADAFAKIKDGYTEEALMVKYGDKETLTKYLKQNQTALNKLQDKGNYLLLIALKDTLRPQKRVKVANAIGSQVNIFGEHDVEEKDIERIGTIRGKYRATGSVFELDAYAIKAD